MGSGSAKMNYVSSVIILSRDPVCLKHVSAVT